MTREFLSKWCLGELYQDRVGRATADEVIEHSSVAFEGISEERLRFHFLGMLNSLFDREATASGETFSVRGRNCDAATIGEA